MNRERKGVRPKGYREQRDGGSVHENVLGNERAIVSTSSVPLFTQALTDLQSAA